MQERVLYDCPMFPTGIIIYRVMYSVCKHGMAGYLLWCQQEHTQLCELGKLANRIHENQDSAIILLWWVSLAINH